MPAPPAPARVPMKPLLGVLQVGCLLWLGVAGCRGKDSNEPPVARPFVSAALDRPAVLAAIPDDARPPETPIGSGLGLHPTTRGGEYEFIFSERGGGVAYVVEKAGKFQVVHDGRAGKPYEAVRAVVLSADGRRCGYGALADGKWRTVVDGVEGEPFSAVERAVFSPDGSHVAYRAMAGERWHLVVDSKVDAGTPARLLKHDFSADASRIVFIDDVGEDGTGKLAVSDRAFKQRTIVAEGVSSFLVNADSSRVAAISASGGQQRVVTFGFARPDRAERSPAYDAISGLAFGPDGVSVAYLGGRAGKRVFVLNLREEPVSSGEMVGLPAIRPDGKGVGALMTADGAVRLRQLFVGGGKEESAYEEAEGPTYGGQGRSHAYAARRGGSWFIVANGKEGPPYDRVVSPVFSPDGRFLVYRARTDGKRFVVVADADGRTIRQHSAYEQVFPVLFTADGKSIAYGVKDGRQLVWKVEPL